MTRIRTRWLAAFAATALLTLSVSSAFGAHPETASNENRGQQISAYVHSLLLGSDEDPDEQLDEETEEEQAPEEEQVDEEQVDEEQATADEPNSHGKCVSEVAKGDEVGGPNENHGGAVSEAARVTCWQTDVVEEPTEEPPTEVSDGPGNSENRGDHGKGHAKNK